MPENGRLAVAGTADTSGLDQPQLKAMFDAAMAQQRPFPEHLAVCVGLRGRTDTGLHDAPTYVAEYLAERLRLPVVPASQCSMDAFPAVVATGAKAIHYWVVVEPAARSGDIVFWAHATFGNLGSEGAKFALRRREGRWVPAFLNVKVMS